MAMSSVTVVSNANRLRRYHPPRVICRTRSAHQFLFPKLLLPLWRRHEQYDYAALNKRFAIPVNWICARSGRAGGCGSE